MPRVRAAAQSFPFSGAKSCAHFPSRESRQAAFESVATLQDRRANSLDTGLRGTSHPFKVQDCARELARRGFIRSKRRICRTDVVGQAAACSAMTIGQSAPARAWRPSTGSTPPSETSRAQSPEPVASSDPITPNATSPASPSVLSFIKCRIKAFEVHAGIVHSELPVDLGLARDACQAATSSRRTLREAMRRLRH